MDSKDLLPDLEKSPPPKSRFYKLSLIVFIAFILTMLVYYFNKPPLDTAEWIILLLVTLGIPVAGTLLFLFKKTAGWVLNTVYFFFSTPATILASIREIMDETIRFIPIASLLLLLGTVACILLLLPSIRRQLKVSTSSFYIALAIPFGLNIFFAWSLFFK